MEPIACCYPAGTWMIGGGAVAPKPAIARHYGHGRCLALEVQRRIPHSWVPSAASARLIEGTPR
jgi:hypothetical protein